MSIPLSLSFHISHLRRQWQAEQAILVLLTQRRETEIWVILMTRINQDC